MDLDRPASGCFWSTVVGVQTKNRVVLSGHEGFDFLVTCSWCCQLAVWRVGFLNGLMQSPASGPCVDPKWISLVRIGIIVQRSLRILSPSLVLSRLRYYYSGVSPENLPPWEPHCLDNKFIQSEVMLMVMLLLSFTSLFCLTQCLL